MIREILGAGTVCHIAFVHDGSPVTIPTAYGVVGDTLVIHGLPARAFTSGAPTRKSRNLAQ